MIQKTTSFDVRCRTLENPTNVETIKIITMNDVADVHKLLIDGFKLTLVAKDKLLGIE